MFLGTMSCIRMTSEWYLKLAWTHWDNLGLQNPFQLVFGLILRLFWNKSGADFEPICGHQTKNHNLGWIFGDLDGPDAVWGDPVPGLDDEHVGTVADDGAHGQPPVIRGQVEGHFFIKLEWIRQHLVQPGNPPEVAEVKILIPGH